MEPANIQGLTLPSMNFSSCLIKVNTTRKYFSVKVSVKILENHMTKINYMQKVKAVSTRAYILLYFSALSVTIFP